MNGPRAARRLAQRGDPRPRRGGGQRRQYHQIRSLTELGIDVRVATLAGPQSDESLNGVVPVARFPPRRALRGGFSASFLRGVDAAVVAHVESLPHFEPTLLRLGTRFAIDFHNVHSRWHRTRGELGQAERWGRTEQHALRIAHASFACSEEEVDELRKLEPTAHVAVCGNGVDPAEWPDTRGARECAVAMFGAWNHEPNREGLQWFANSVWPGVLRRVPDARLILLGPGEPPPVPASEHFGWVESLADRLASVRVVIVPIRRGMGARVKFGEALASGAAVVATSVGAQGFDATGAWVRADDELGFVAACARLLRHPVQAAELGERGRALALSHLTWGQTTQELASWLCSSEAAAPRLARGRRR